MITLKIDNSTWPKVEDYLLQQGYSDILWGRIFIIRGRLYNFLHLPSDNQHISYLMIKFNAVDFTEEYLEIAKYRLDYYY